MHKTKNYSKALEKTVLNNKNVITHLVDDVAIPAGKKLVVDFFKNGIEMLVYGNDSRDRKRSVADKVSYNSMYSHRDRYYEEPRTRRGMDFDVIVFDNRGDAEMVLARMDDVIDQYGWVRVSDLYDLLGMSCDYTCNDYGWSSLGTARIVPLRSGGFGLDLPRASVIRR